MSAIRNVIWYRESEASPNTVVRFDPKAQKFQRWAIPGGGNILRNTSVTRDGDFVLANSLVNVVTLVRIAKSRAAVRRSMLVPMMNVGLMRARVDERGVC